MCVVLCGEGVVDDDDFVCDEVVGMDWMCVGVCVEFGECCVRCVGGVVGGGVYCVCVDG